MMAALPLPSLDDDDGARPTWAAIIASLPPSHRRVAIDYLIQRDREAREARAEAARLRPPLSRADRLRQRNNTIREALWLVDGGSVSGRAMELQNELRRYAGNGWTRERDLSELPPGASDLRRALHRIMRLNEGRTLAQRRLFEIAK